MRPVTFITGNQHKADHMAALLGMPIAHTRLELEELQSNDARFIVEHKARQAFAWLSTPVLVEDISLEFDALNGLPGPFIKFFIESERGDELLCRMLDGFADRHATARCLYAYDDGQALKIIEGSCRGMIADSPRGTGGYGWDRVFELDGNDNRTCAELDDTAYADFQRSLKPFGELRAFLSH